MPCERRAAMTERADDYRRIVADADVLAADLLCGGDARGVMNEVRSHSWLELVVTTVLVDDAESVVATLGDDRLAADWRATVDDWDQVTVVEQPGDDHPALAAAYRGDALHVVSMDDDLQTARTGAGLRGLMDVSVRSPAAFTSVFDPAAVYELVYDDPYPGPDRDGSPQ